MHLLGLDIGMRRTGVAYCNTDAGVAVPLATIQSKGDAELVTAIRSVIAERKIDHLVLGLPRLPSGDEGEQAAYVRAISEKLSGIPLSFIDERHTSLQHRDEPVSDPDSRAACQILTTYVDRMSDK